MELSFSDDVFGSLSVTTVPAKTLTPPIPPIAKAFLILPSLNSMPIPKLTPKAKELSKILLKTLDFSILLI